MACACKGRSKQRFLWYKGEADKPVVYNSEIEAKAKVLRRGGKYIPYNSNLSIGAQIANAESQG